MPPRRLHSISQSTPLNYLYWSRRLADWLERRIDHQNLKQPSVMSHYLVEATFRPHSTITETTITRPWTMKPSESTHRMPTRNTNISRHHPFQKVRHSGLCRTQCLKIDAFKLSFWTYSAIVSRRICSSWWYCSCCNCCCCCCRWSWGEWPLVVCTTNCDDLVIVVVVVHWDVLVRRLFERQSMGGFVSLQR